jgi:hypothetical protein
MGILPAVYRLLELYVYKRIHPLSGNDLLKGNTDIQVLYPPEICVSIRNHSLFCINLSANVCRQFSYALIHLSLNSDSR